jgi:hypothetical protein
LHKADKANTTAAQPTVQPAPATIARVPETPSAPTPATAPDPNQIRPPGNEVGPV